MMRYLGAYSYEIDFENSADELNDIDEDIVMCWRNIDNFKDTHSLDFMRVEDSIFHGVMGETNTSALGIKISECGNEAKIWRIW